jgi:hypothetical protein
MARHHAKIHATDDEPTEDDIAAAAAKLAAHEAEVAAEEAAMAAERAERLKACVKIMLLVDHVYLPEDTTADDWESARVTMRYDGRTEDGRRVRVDVHPSLAAFLQERGQAEIL